MRKEPLIAIIIGSLIGVGVAFSLWHMNRSTSETIDTSAVNSDSQQNNFDETTQITNTQTDFSISSPADFSVEPGSQISITGQTNSNAYVVALADDVAITTADQSGNFNLEIEIASGLNQIKLWSVNSGEVPKQAEMTIIGSQNATQGSTSFLGTVTDIAEETFQVRTPNGTIEQLAISPETAYLNIVEETEEIEFSDIAIGDYIVALGKPENNIMQVEQIMVTTAPEEAKTIAMSVVIDTLSAREFLVINNENSEQVSVDATGDVETYTFEGKTAVSTRLSNSEAGDEIFIIGEFDEEELIASIIILL